MHRSADGTTIGDVSASRHTKLTWRDVPRSVWALGLVALFMDISSELVHSLLPMFLVGVLGVSTLVVGVIEGIAEASAAIAKCFRVFSATASASASSLSGSATALEQSLSRLSRLPVRPLKSSRRASSTALARAFAALHAMPWSPILPRQRYVVRHMVYAKRSIRSEHSPVRSLLSRSWPSTRTISVLYFGGPSFPPRRQ